jgi:fructosamine-3-kinase
MRTFTKRDLAAPEHFFACEAAGLQWLSDVPAGARCVRVRGCHAAGLTLEYLESATPAVSAARAFGAGLAHTHDAGAPGFGAPPDGWYGPGFFGPLRQPLPMSYSRSPAWGVFYAAERLGPMLEKALPQLDSRTIADIDIVMTRCRRGDFDDDDAPARLHGDLWAGNLIWTADGVVLIDPAAHGGHRETDLAMLALFGAPYLDTVIEGYQGVHPLRPGWRERSSLHQLYPLLAHVVLFGAGYLGQTALAAHDAARIS